MDEVLAQLRDMALEAQYKGHHVLAADLRQLLDWHKCPEKHRRVTICFPGDRSAGIFPYYLSLTLDSDFFDADEEVAREALRAAFNEISGDNCGVLFPGESGPAHPRLPRLRQVGLLGSSREG
jgi:hypothetical protein